MKKRIGGRKLPGWQTPIGRKTPLQLLVVFAANSDEKRVALTRASSAKRLPLCVK
jgi:hypothetical protein